VREGVTGIQKSQGQAPERLERTSESLAITADYLVAIAEDDDEVEHDGDFTDEEAVADTALEVADDEGASADDDAPRVATDAADSRSTIGTPTSNASKKPGSPGVEVGSQSSPSFRLDDRARRGRPHAINRGGLESRCGERPTHN